MQRNCCETVGRVRAIGLPPSSSAVKVHPNLVSKSKVEHRQKGPLRPSKRRRAPPQKGQAGTSVGLTL